MSSCKYIPFIILLISLLSCQKKFPYGDDGLVADCVTQCKLEPETGPCKALIKKYHFNKISKKCQSFDWGGCQGVVPFDTLEACESCDCK